MENVRLALRGTPRPVLFCPVSAHVDRSVKELKQSVLMDTSRKAPVPFQVEPATGGATIHWIVESLAPGQEREYVLRDGKQETPGPQARAQQDDDATVSVRIGGSLFTRYLCGQDGSKPCLYPLIGPFGQGVTRAYPFEEVEDDSTDHIHHRSVFVAWGDVNGCDNWGEEAGHGRMVHRYFDAVESGPVFARIVSLNDWVDADGNRLLQDRLSYTFYNCPASFRLFDVDVTLYASEGEVRFGDTKEGGILSFRVAAPMEAKRTGRIENSFGGVNENETWGKRASWCDYSGLVGGHTVGLAAFDHPSNPRYPTYWHVRNYGLMTANPFGLSQFIGEGYDGSLVLASGQNLCFRYRVLVHAGDAAQGGVGGKYLDWIYPPRAEVLD